MILVDRLSWQTLVKEAGFEGRKIGGGIPPEAAGGASPFVAGLQACSHGLPRRQIPWLQVGRCDVCHLRRHRRYHPHRPAHRHGCRRLLPPRRPPLMAARRPEVLLQAIVRTWDRRILITGK